MQINNNNSNVSIRPVAPCRSRVLIILSRNNVTLTFHLVSGRVLRREIQQNDVRTKLISRQRGVIVSLRVRIRIPLVFHTITFYSKALSMYRIAKALIVVGIISNFHSNYTFAVQMRFFFFFYIITHLNLYALPFVVI